ncbi:MAG: TonB-dependent receptor domain-containing protein [Janthinobacterium lividum]
MHPIKKLKQSYALASSLLLICSVPAFAQFDAASVLGYVRDNSGASIGNASVTLINVQTGVTLTTHTDSEGRYEFDSVKIGDYRVSASSASFSITDTPPFALSVNARQRVDVGLRAGELSQTVEVSAVPTELETETSSRGQVIGTKEVENLPLNGRSYADLVLLTPGVRKSALEDGSVTQREASFNVNGQRSAFNNFLLDGLDNNNYGTSNQGFANENIPPSPDAVDEFRVETDNYSAEYGRNPGAVINVSVRRGTNEFHGKAYNYNRNTALNAAGPFLATGLTKPKLIRNQFGGTFGGPIVRDHTFFFVDYEGTRQVFNSTVFSTLPSANQRAGIFYLNDDPSNPANAIPLKNPITGATYLGTIPTGVQTVFAKTVLGDLPGNTASGLGSNYTSAPRGTIQDDKGDGRIDHTFSQRLSVFGRYSEHRGAIFAPGAIPGLAGGNNNGDVNIQNRDIAGGLTYAIRPTKLLDVRFGYSRNIGGKSPINIGQPSLLVQSGITDGLPTDPTIVRSLNGQAVTGFTQFGSQTSNPQFQDPTIYNPKVNFTMIQGRHSVKLGYEYQAVNTQVNDFNPSYGQDNYAGVYSSNGNPTNATVTAGSPSLATQLQQAHNLADFLFGNRSSYALTNFTVVNLRQRFNFAYVQDDIKVSPNLTFNAGLRYELVTPQYERDNRLGNFDPATNTIIQGSSGSIYNRALVDLPTKNVAPRFGFAYSASPGTVIRGGYGITYVQFNRAGGENNLTYNGPNVVNASINQVAPTPASLCTNDTQLQSACFRQTQQGYSNILTTPAYFNPANVTTRYIPRAFQTGYVQSYFVGIQRDLGAGFLLDIAYVGNKSTHLQVLADYNQGLPCTLATSCPTLAARRPVQGFGDIEIAYGAGSANFNSLQTRLEKRLRSGLFLLNSFTYSRTFDISSGHLETSNGDNSRVNYASPSQDYGPSGYDQPLNDTLSAIYDLPYGHGRRFGGKSNAVVNEVLGGWQLTLINTVTSGLPFNINYSLSSASPLYDTDLVTYRPNRVAGQPLFNPASSRTRTVSGGPILGYLNPAAFSNPTTAPFGTMSRNALRSQPYYDTDLGIHKLFALPSERMNLEFRAEAFNVLNKVNLQAPNSTTTSSTFGYVTSSYAPRQLQLAAKLIF